MKIAVILTEFLNDYAKNYYHTHSIPYLIIANNCAIFLNYSNNYLNCEKGNKNEIQHCNF